MCHIRIVLGRSIIFIFWNEMGDLKFVLNFVLLKFSKKGRASISICMEISYEFYNSYLIISNLLNGCPEW